jgi:hypothetical protein
MKPWPSLLGAAVPAMGLAAGLAACSPAPAPRGEAPVPPESPLLAPMNKAREAAAQVEATQAQREKAIRDASH